MNFNRGLQDNTDGERESGAEAHALSRDAGLARVIEALCGIMVICGFLAASGGSRAIIGGSDFLFLLIILLKPN
jgi:hypothetical protein